MKKNKNSNRAPGETDRMIGERLRLLRMERGMSQTELGQALGGLSFQQIQKYEHGTNRIGSGRLSEIVKILRTDYDYMFGDKGTGKKIKTNTAINDFLMSRQGKMLLEAMIKICDPEKRRAVISLARQLAGTRD